MMSECLNLTELSVCLTSPHEACCCPVMTCVMMSSLNWLTLHGCASYLLRIFIFEVKRDIQLLSWTPQVPEAAKPLTLHGSDVMSTDRSPSISELIITGDNSRHEMHSLHFNKL